jgi:hypothetical protein
MRKKMDNARRTGPALEKAYQFVLWLLPTVEKFPRGQRLLLGDRIQTTVLEVTEGIVEATYSAQSGPNCARSTSHWKICDLCFVSPRICAIRIYAATNSPRAASTRSGI